MKYITTDEAPKPVGPYSQGVIAGDYLFVSGQIPINPLTGELIREPFEKAAEQAIKNIISVVRAAGGDVENIVKVTVYINDISRFAEFNNVYSKFFTDHKPARAVVEVSSLPKGAPLEMEAIAYIKGKN